MTKTINVDEYTSRYYYFSFLEFSFPHVFCLYYFQKKILFFPFLIRLIFYTWNRVVIGLQRFLPHLAWKIMISCQLFSHNPLFFGSPLLAVWHYIVFFFFFLTRYIYIYIYIFYENRQSTRYSCGQNNCLSFLLEMFAWKFVTILLAQGFFFGWGPRRYIRIPSLGPHC